AAPSSGDASAKCRSLDALRSLGVTVRYRSLGMTRRRRRSRGVHGPPLARPGPTPVIPRRDAVSGQGDDVSRNVVLVLSSDPLAAALPGAAIELAGHAPTFQQADESPRGALLRLRPALVVIDCD